MGRLQRTWRQATGFVASTALTVLVWSSRASAQVVINPTTAGMPGGAMAQTVVNWIAGAALLACAATVTYGGSKWRGGVKSGNGYGAQDGKEFVIGGFVCAAIVGLAALGVNAAFAAGQGG